MNFALRLLWMLKYFTHNYDFDFFLRVDDDYFVCLQHLLTELPQRPKTALWWGWIHCKKNIVRVDEGFMILTYDIIKESLDRLNTSLMCSGTGDPAVALWVTSSKLKVTYFYDNDRLVHSPGKHIGKYLKSGMCHKYIGLHQAYPESMYKYWRFIQQDEMTRKGKPASEFYHVPSIPEFSKVCDWSKTFDWREFKEKFRFEPKPCRDSPTWRSSSYKFLGREKEAGTVWGLISYFL